MIEDSGDIPKDMEVIETVLYKTLKSGFIVEVKLVKRPMQYEAALFVNGKYKPGPPVPRPMDAPAGEATHWMGIRPKVGFTTEEADEILDAVSGQNVLRRIHFVDKWGVRDED
jgi:hypothetical protein